MGGNLIKNNVIEYFEETIYSAVEKRPIPFLEERYAFVESINEEYIEATGDNLHPFLLAVLTDWILAETLKDKDVDKVTNTEFAILSHRQLKRRYIRESAVDDEVLNYLEQKYVKRQDSLAKTLKKEVGC